MLSMLDGWVDYKNSINRKLMGTDKIDPGTYSFMQPGWWALHATAITAVYVLGNKLSNRK